jgi:hypothetical protein
MMNCFQVLRFKFNLRRYDAVAIVMYRTFLTFITHGGAVQVDSIKTRVESAHGFNA